MAIKKGSTNAPGLDHVRLGMLQCIAEGGEGGAPEAAVAEAQAYLDELADLRHDVFAARNSYLIRMCAAGLTHAEIARATKLSKQRVGQILAEVAPSPDDDTQLD